MDAATVKLITDAVSFSYVITGIAAIAVAVAAVYIAVKGAKMLLGMIKGA